MKRLLPILFILTIFLFGTYTVNVYLKEETRKQKMEGSLERPLYLNLEDSSRSVTLKEIGVLYDSSKDKVSIDQDKLEDFFNSLEKEYSFLAKNTIISFEDYTFRVPGDEAKVSIDRSIFENPESASHLLLDSSVKIQVKIDTVGSPEVQKEKTEGLVEKITQPLLIKYGRNPIYISKETLKSFVTISEAEGIYTGSIESRPISNYLDDLTKMYGSEDVVVIHPQAIDSIRRALLFRAADYQVNNAVILPLEGKPHSNGELHDVYLEVIKSQQRLYRFEGGKLVKTYIVSTGLTWETPPGEYTIQGKQRMTISYFGNWYMPHYLPLGYVNGSYRFGFHAIPYHMDGNGNIFSRDINTMGSPATGGCIQLKPDEAEELFEWANIGIPVYIYE